MREPIGLLAIDPTNLRELILWTRMARHYIEAHTTEADAYLRTLAPVANSTHLAITKDRLEHFAKSLAEILEQVQVDQAVGELSHLPKDKLN